MSETKLTVGDLKRLLEPLDDNQEVLVKTYSYGESLDYVLVAELPIIDGAVVIDVK